MWACHAALGLEKFARADHHDILEKRRLGNADADSTRGHGHILSAPAKKLKVNLTLPLEVDQTTTMYS